MTDFFKIITKKDWNSAKHIAMIFIVNIAFSIVHYFKICTLIDSLRHVYARYFYAIRRQIRQTHTHSHTDYEMASKLALKRRRKNYGLTFFSTEQSQIFLGYKNVARNRTQTYKTMYKYLIVQLN